MSIGSQYIRGRRVCPTPIYERSGVLKTVITNEAALTNLRTDYVVSTEETEKTATIVSEYSITIT